MTPLKFARIRVCGQCEHRTKNPAWPWPRCGADNRELNDDAFDGPETDCPQNQWRDINVAATTIDIRRAACATCEHQVMKAGFQAPRCRFPGNDVKLTNAILSGQDVCPSGAWGSKGITGGPPLQFTADTTDFDANLAATREKLRRFSAEADAEIKRRSKICDACPDKKCALKHCSGCRKRKLLAKPLMVCPANPPQWGPMAPPTSQLLREPPLDTVKVVWTISAWNEPLLRGTVQSLLDSVVDPHYNFDVIVVDDGSTDGCADDLPCHVIRNETPLGIGLNLNTAADYAITHMGADVVGVADAHMKVPAGSVETLAKRALEEPCVVCSASLGWEQESKFLQFGAYLTWRKRDAVASKWMGDKWPKLADGSHRPPEEWGQVQVPLGAFYAYSAETIELLKAPTGRLWETVVGRWGFLLEPFSIKCLLMNVPVYVGRDVAVRHFYRKTNPLPKAHREKVNNGAFGFASVLSQDTFENYTRTQGHPTMHKWCITRGGIDRQEVEALIKRGRAGVKRLWTPEAERALLDTFPILDDKDGKHEADPIPLEKIVLAKRDKMLRAGKAGRK